MQFSVVATWSLCTGGGRQGLSCAHSTRGHHMKLFKKPSRLLLRSNFFTRRVISTWNALPEEVVSAPTVSIFKASLDSHWTDIEYGYEQRPRA